MELGTAVMLLLLFLAGGVLSLLCLRGKRKLRMICGILCGLGAVLCAVYIGLTLLFVDAVEHQPPSALVQGMTEKI